ncbi:putative porin [Larkinella sp. VNQ87]|uniref:putative porin n=1 Tax=Larkinella sp. VNQ87 TaxID=3400921 RepID=UPI003BFCBCC0
MNRLYLLSVSMLLFGWIQTAKAQFPSRLPNFPQGGNRGGGATGGQGGSAGGAILDDSTKLVYGPTTTRYFLESDVLNNRKKLFPIDTTLEGVQRTNYLSRYDYLYTDLGNLGTALRPLYYETPAIGSQTGLNVYGLYGYQTQNVRYFDTRSPYTNMYLVLGGRGQNILNFDFSRNINPRFNLGFNLQRMTSDDQYSGTSTTTSTSTQRLIENWNFVAHGNYRSKSNKYTLLAHYNNLNHRSKDQGGVVEPATFTTDVIELAPVLSSANSHEKRNDLHVYQQFVLDTAFQVYHTLDFRAQSYRYTDTNMGEGLQTDTTTPALQRPFYPSVYFDSTEIRQTTLFRALDNQLGLKGQFAFQQSAFNYRAWLRNRLYRQTTLFNVERLRPDSSYVNSRFETYLGGWLGYYFPDSLTRVTAEAEYLLGRDFRFQGRLESRFLTAGYESIFASPTLIQNRFISNVYQWDHIGRQSTEFDLRGTQHIYGQLNLRLGKLTISPGIDYYLLTNYIYFDTAGVPRQLSSAFSILRTGLGLQLRLGKFRALGQGYSTLVSNDDVLRIPTLMANAQLEYNFLLFKKLYVLAGLQFHYKSAYFADRYMPLTQQYHLQNDTKLGDYLLAEPFVNFRINRVRLFVKLAHANQELLGQIYYSAPYFRTISRSVSFGVHWLLFD